MKNKTYELLYDTQEQFNTAQGNSGNITSVTPGVAYISENDKVGYNKTDDTLFVIYNVDDITEPTKIYNAAAVKNELNHVFIDKESHPVSSLASTYQFHETGLHVIIYRYANLTSLPTNGFYGCTNIVSVIFPESLTQMNNGCLLECSGIKNLTIPFNVNTNAFDRSGNGFGKLLIQGNLDCVKAYPELGYKEVEITNNISVGVTSNRYLVDISRSNDIESIKIHGNLTIQTDGVDRTLLGYSTGRKPGSVKFIEIGGNVILTSGSGRMFQGGTVFHTDGAILHFPKPEVVCSPGVCNASFNRLTKIYVGDGSSQAHDQEILDQYLNDANWAAYTNKLDLWYNYNGPYKQ